MQRAAAGWLCMRMRLACMQHCCSSLRMQLAQVLQQLASMPPVLSTLDCGSTMADTYATLRVMHVHALLHHRQQPSTRAAQLQCCSTPAGRSPAPQPAPHTRLCPWALQGDKPVVWRGPMVNRMIDQFLTGTEWGRLDALVVDLPPGGWGGGGGVQMVLVVWVVFLVLVRSRGAGLVAKPRHREPAAAWLAPQQACLPLQPSLHIRH